MTLVYFTNRSAESVLNLSLQYAGITKMTVTDNMFTATYINEFKQD